MATKLLLDRNVARGILVPGMLLNLVAWVIIKAKRSRTTPEIVQDANPALDSRQLQRLVQWQHGHSFYSEAKIVIQFIVNPDFIIEIH